MIEVPDLGDDFHGMWKELMRLAKSSPAPWTLIGAQMVALHGWASGRTQIRPSKDADLLVNVRATTNATSRFSDGLIAAGYEPDLPSPEGVGHRFRKAGVTIDLLAPDGVGARASVATTPGARTVFVPGGSQALKRTSPVAVRSRTSRGSVPMPDLLGAILVKVRAIDVDESPEAQRRDVAFLLTLVDEPDVLASRLSRAERRWLRRHMRFADPRAECWAGLARPEEGAIIYRRLTAADA